MATTTTVTTPPTTSKAQKICAWHRKHQGNIALVLAITAIILAVLFLVMPAPWLFWTTIGCVLVALILMATSRSKKIRIMGWSIILVSGGIVVGMWLVKAKAPVVVVQPAPPPHLVLKPAPTPVPATAPYQVVKAPTAPVAPVPQSVIMIKHSIVLNHSKMTFVVIRKTLEPKHAAPARKVVPPPHPAPAPAARQQPKPVSKPISHPMALVYPPVWPIRAGKGHAVCMQIPAKRWIPIDGSKLINLSFVREWQKSHRKEPARVAVGKILAHYWLCYTTSGVVWMSKGLNPPAMVYEGGTYSPYNSDHVSVDSANHPLWMASMYSSTPETVTFWLQRRK